MVFIDFSLMQRGSSLAPLLVALACGSSADSDDPSSASSPSPSDPPAASSNSTPPPALVNIPPETVEAVTDAVEMAAGQLRAACGPAFDNCSTTAGCNEVIACAARNACGGSACFCTDESCQTAGPCRSVIEATPGARVPDAANPSLGPASDAAAAVAECLLGLGNGLLSPPPSSGGNAPDAG